MIAKLLPVVLLALGAGAGVGAGVALRPAPAAVPDGGGADVAATDGAEDHESGDGGGHGKGEEIFVDLDQQFVVPVLEDGRVNSMVVMSLTLDVTAEAEELAQTRRPRLRDSFLRVMLDHANTGGFDGTFTSNGAMDRLRGALKDVGRRELGPGLREVLILDFNRQDV